VANKCKLEHKAKYIKMDGETWAEELVKIERLCNQMQEEGWALHTMSWPDKGNAVLVFTRPQN